MGDIKKISDHADWRDPDPQKPAEKIYDPYNPFLEDGPPEWFEGISDEDWEAIRDMRQRAQIGNLLTPKDRALIDRIAANRWMLMRNVWGWKCGRCGVRHDYLTTGCIERPVNGINQLMLMLAEVTGNDAYSEDHVYSLIRAGTVEYVSEREAKRYLDAIVDRFGEAFLTAVPRKERKLIVIR